MARSRKKSAVSSPSRGKKTISSNAKREMIHRAALREVARLRACGVPAFVNFELPEPEKPVVDEFGFTEEGIADLQANDAEVDDIVDDPVLPADE